MRLKELLLTFTTPFSSEDRQRAINVFWCGIQFDLIVTKTSAWAKLSSDTSSCANDANTFLLVVRNLSLERVALILESPIFLFPSSLQFWQSGEVSWKNRNLRMTSLPLQWCWAARAGALLQTDCIIHPLGMYCSDVVWVSYGKFWPWKVTGMQCSLYTNHFRPVVLQVLRVTSEDSSFPCKNGRCPCNALVFCNLKMFVCWFLQCEVFGEILSEQCRKVYCPNVLWNLKYKGFVQWTEIWGHFGWSGKVTGYKGIQLNVGKIVLKFSDS